MIADTFVMRKVETFTLPLGVNDPSGVDRRLQAYTNVSSEYVYLRDL